MNTKPSSMWHMIFWAFIFTLIVTVVLVGALVTEGLSPETLRDSRTWFQLSQLIGGAGLATSIYISVVVGLTLGIVTDLLLENKDKQITAESILKRRYIVYVVVFAVVMGIVYLLTSLPPLDTFNYPIGNQIVVSGILAILMVAATHRYLSLLLSWANAIQAETAQADAISKPEKPTTTSDGQAKKRRKDDLPPLVFKSDDS